MNREAPISPDDLLVHTEALRRLACALLRDKGLAEDVVQQAFVMALEQPPPRSDGLGAWLRRVVRHRAIDLQRTSEHRMRRERAVARLEAVPCHTKAAEGIALQREVVDAVAALPEPYRTAIYLRYYEGLAPRAIAARESIPVKTIKTQLWRGLDMLRRRLDVRHRSRRTWAGMLLPIARGNLVQPFSGGALKASAAGVLAMNAKTVVGFCIGLILLAAAVLVVDWGLEDGPSNLERETTQAAAPEDQRSEPLFPPNDTTTRRAVVTEPFAEPEAAATRAGELLVQCVWSDESPASGVRVVIEPKRQTFLGLEKQCFVSGVEGRVLVTELAPGRFTVLSDRGQPTDAQVAAGERAEVQLKMRRGVDVRGLVVNANKIPVPGAQVWLAGDVLDWSSGFPTARCGADGRFLLRSIRPEDSLWASAPRHGPSALADLEGRDVASGSVEVELSLSEVGAALRGRVVDAQGEAVKGARIALGVPPPGYLETRVDGTRIEILVPRIAISHKNGLFEFEGVAPGLQSIVAQAEGWPIWRRELTVEVTDTPPLLIQLERGAFVRGVVHDESGKPLEGAVVIALPVPFQDRFPGRGFTDKGKPFPHPGARTDALGAFRLPPIAAGQVHLYASKGERTWTTPDEKNVDFKGTAQETLTIYAGQEVVWSPQISLGATIEGRVSYADGAPMQRVFVHAQQEVKGPIKTTTTDSEGKFRIRDLADGSYRVSVVLRGAPTDTEPLIREGIRPNSGLLELQARFSKDQVGTGRVAIRFKDDGRRVKGKPAIVFADARNWFRAELSRGVYTATLRPGLYRPVAMTGATEVGEGSWFDLNSGDNLDLGTLVSAPGGHVIIRVDRKAALNGDLEVSVHPADGLPKRTRASLVLREGQGELRVENLSSGPAEVALWGEHCLGEKRQVDIIPNATSEVNIALRRGSRRDFEFHGNVQRGWGTFNLTLRDSSGGVVYQSQRDESAKSQGAFRYSVALPLGRFSLDARTASGLKYLGDVEFSSFDTTERTLRFELR